MRKSFILHLKPTIIIVILISTILGFTCCKTNNNENNVFTNFLDKTKKDYSIINSNIKPLSDTLLHINNSIGVLTLSDKFNEQDTIRVYNEDGSVWYKFSFLYDDSDGKYDYYNKNFLPLAFHPDYFLLALSVNQNEDKRYEVIVNQNTFLKKYIYKKDKHLKFENWIEHILNVYAINFDPKTNPLRKEPKVEAAQISFKPEGIYRPVKVDGDWLQVNWETNQNKNFGWIKWKKDHKLLIDPVYLN